MAVISADIFLRIADRLSQQYQLLKNLEPTLNTPAAFATLTTVLAGSNNDLVFTSVKNGTPGNLYTITYVNPGTTNHALTGVWSGNDLIITLATDAGSAITTTANALLTFISATSSIYTKISATLAPGNDGTGLLIAMAKTALSGGINGLFAPMITATDNDDLEEVALASADTLDTNFTAQNLVVGFPSIAGLINALKAHFSDQSVNGLIDGFLTTNDVRVHANFDQLYAIATSSHLSAKNVFRPDVINLGSITLSDAGYATATIVTSGAAATVLISPTGSSNHTRYTAVNTGVIGNSINITYLDPQAPSQPLYVEVEGRDIIVHLATDGSSVIISTAAQVRAAVNANTAAAALVLGTTSGAETGVVAPVVKTYLTNLNNSLTFTAKSAGAEGNEITIKYTDPLAASQPLTVTNTISTTQVLIDIGLSTDSSFNITATAASIKAAIDADPVASSYVTVIPNGDVSGIVSTWQTPLVGGAATVITSPNPLGTGSGLAADGNYAAQKLQLTLIPALKTAYLDLYPANAYAFVDIDPPGANNSIRYRAKTAGVAGNSVQIQYIYSQQPSLALVITVVGNLIKVTLATDAGSVITTTAAALVSAINAHPSASLLVAATNNDAGSGLIPGNWPTTFLTNIRTKVRYTAKAVGFAGESVRVSYVDPGAPSAAESVTVSGNDILVHLATDAGSNITSTASSIIASVNGTPASSALVLAAPPPNSSVDGVVAAVPYTNLDYASGPNLRRTTTLNLTLLRSDLVTVQRTITFTAGAVPGTLQALPLPNATLLLTPLSTTNSTILYTAINPGSAGNAITIEYAAPTTPNSPLSVTVTGNAVKLNLATDQNSRPITTADDAFALFIATPAVTSILGFKNIGPGWGYLAAVPPTHLQDGQDVERFYACTAVSPLVGGESGDIYNITQIVERVMSL